ncbi:hypothetical protein C8R46DRAFT_961500 [Mycena filopes]|nr:hypothetical protein C8R46DRAFT_961500 [Mycena filopes]
MESPFKDLLFTNAVPSDADCQRIRALLVGPQKEVAQIGDEIHRLETLLNELVVKRDRLNGFIDAHLALISPVRRLPEDVVAEIFAASLPSDRNAVMSETESPLLLCRVSQAWRALALSTPRLWASLHIPVPAGDMPQLTERVSSWLLRSGSLPLSLSAISAPHLYVGGEPLDTTQVVETLKHFSTRWQHLNLSLDSHDSFKPLADLTPRDVPILQSLVLKYGVWSGHPTGLPPDWRSNFGFTGAATIRSLAIRGMTIPSDLPARWDQLQHLSLGAYSRHFDPSSTITVGTALAILRQCPELVTCSLVVLDSPPGHTPDPPFCHMEKLKQLRVTNSQHVFPTLIAPNLQALEYRDLAPPQFSEHLEFMSVLNGTTLTRLALGVTLTQLMLAQILPLVPLLEELWVYQSCMYSSWLGGDANEGSTVETDLVHLLTPLAQSQSLEASESGLCPHLARITLLQFNQLSDQTLLDFICARNHIGYTHSGKLSRVRVHFVRAMQVDIVPALQDLISGGLQLSVTYAPPPKMTYSPSEMLPVHDADWASIATHWADS